MNKGDLKTVKEKTLVSGIDMNKRDLKEVLSKTHKYIYIYIYIYIVNI